MHLARKSVDADALIHNYSYLKSVGSGTRVLAVVKSDAYGHGLVGTSLALSRGTEVDGFAVAVVAEGIALRDAGVTETVLVMQGTPDERGLHLAAERDLTLVVHSPEQLALLEGHDGKTPALWVKFDTGMGRLGFALDDADQVLTRVGRLHGLPREPVLMSHFAYADDPAAGEDDEAQWRRFERVLRGNRLAASIANSAGFFCRPDSRLQWARVGVALYGAPPERVASEHRQALKPVMSVTAPVVAVRRCKAGDRIGYGGDYRCPQDMKIGVVGIGYGDGYPRHARTGTPVWIGGKRRELVGRVSMDMVTVAFDADDPVCVGDVAELWGKHLPVAEVAEHCGTISYELLCGARGIREARSRV